MRKKLLLIAFLGTISLGFSQPPPPHPGGSGNAGASIPASIMVLSVVSAALLYKTKLQKR